MRLADRLLARDDLRDDPLARELVPVLTSPVLTSSAGYPYLQQPGWTRFRDWVPHVLSAGNAVLAATARVVAAAEDERDRGADPEAVANTVQASRVVRQVVLTASVTAPPELWLLRQVLSALDDLGLRQRLLDGEAIDPDTVDGVAAHELWIDLRFLLARGYLVRRGTRLRLSRSSNAREVFTRLTALPARLHDDLTEGWRAAFASDADVRVADLADGLPGACGPREPGRWQATADEIEIGHRLVPVVLGLRAADRIPALLSAGRIDADTLLPDDPDGGAAAVRVLRAAGVVDEGGTLTIVGRRMLERGPGPFGIIATYQPYLRRLSEILRQGRAGMHVRRSGNVAASQDANRRTFEKANDSLDRFCDDTGFTYDVFVEHAVGKGEATRQRWERDEAAAIHYVGADLEDAAIDAAVAERDAGRLPPGMQFVRGADIGRPDIVVKALRELGLHSEGAVMVVGNGFHEIRDQTDARMEAVFRDYEAAGFLLIFTEESALSVDALLETAWNTYHAGFRYVHERSGQGLRPAVPEPASPLEGALPASWTECAERAGYVRATDYCTRTRTIHPYTPATGHNPSISENHFFVPGRIAARLGLSASVSGQT